MTKQQQQSINRILAEISTPELAAIANRLIGSGEAFAIIRDELATRSDYKT